jgi:histidine triad (HIT) family protein
MTAKECVFCAIALGKAPARIIARSEHAIAFLDATPSSIGHTVVIPRAHYESIFDCDEKTWSAVTDLAKVVADTMKRENLAEGVNILHASGESAQQSVQHLHLHVLPRHHDDGLDAWVRTEKKK